jgi:hypothetical protein
MLRHENFLDLNFFLFSLMKVRTLGRNRMTYSLEDTNYFRSGATKAFKMGGFDLTRKELHIPSLYDLTLTICIPVDRKAVNVGMGRRIERPPRLPASIPKP